MKKIVILFLLLCTPAYAQINDQQPNYFMRSGTIIIPRTSGNSISIDSAGSAIISGDIVYHAVPFPTGTPADNEIIKYDAALKRFAFEADAGGAGSPGGNDTDVQFNDGGSFGGESAFKYHKSTNSLRVDGRISADIISVDSTFTYQGTPIITIISGDVGTLKTQTTQLSSDAAIWNGGSLIFTISNGTSALTTANKAWVCMPYNAKIISWDVSILPAGAVQLDVMTDIASGFPPIAGDTNTGTFKPHIDATNTVSSDATLAGWDTNLLQNEYVMVSVDSATTATQVTLSLRLKKN